MKNCNGCKHAQWQRNARDHLHPSGDGMCGYVYVLPPLPPSMYFGGGLRVYGGTINRHRDLAADCVHYSRGEYGERA